MGNRLSKIYTKTGDLGNTSLIGGTKVPKNHLRIESYGTVGELNSYIGLVSDSITDEHSKIILKEIQDRLFTIGSSLACDPDKEPLMKLPDLKEADVACALNMRLVTAVKVVVTVTLTVVGVCAGTRTVSSFELVTETLPSGKKRECPPFRGGHSRVLRRVAVRPS